MDKIFGNFFKIFGLGFLAWIIFSVATIYVVMSLLVSTAKVATDSCGKTWNIEKVFSGDWMCEK